MPGGTQAARQWIFWPACSRLDSRIQNTIEEPNRKENCYEKLIRKHSSRASRQPQADCSCQLRRGNVVRGRCSAGAGPPADAAASKGAQVARTVRWRMGIGI